LLTILLTIGIIIKDAGRLTMKPMMNARGHFSKNPAKPTFANVKARDIENYMLNDVKTANSIMEYFLSIFIITTIQLI
jgi:hypothetical protein